MRIYATQPRLKVQPLQPARFSAGDRSGHSSVFIRHLSGGGISVMEGNSWSSIFNAPDAEEELQLEPDKPIVLGRQNGGDVPYLQKGYRPSNTMPGTNAPITQSDETVSRAHFQLIARADGSIDFVNGVPGRDNQLRAPTNGTTLLAPENRSLNPGEIYNIAAGQAAKLKLGATTIILISANGIKV